MSLLDPNIILQAGNINDPSKVLTLRDLAMKVQAQQQQTQSKNALKQLFTQPGALDSTGNPTPQTIAGVMAIDPETGMALHQNLVTQQETRAKLDDNKLARMGTIQGLIDPVRTASINAYDAAIKAGQPVQAANEAAQKVLDEGLQPITQGGLLHPDEASQLTTKFDYGTFTARSADWQKQQEKAKEDAKAAAAEAERERHDKAIEAHGQEMEGIAVGKSGDTGWQVLTDPSKKDEAGNPIQYRYNPGMAKATTLDGAPYEPGGAAKIGGATGAATLNQDAADLIADEYLGGNKGAATGMARSPANIAMVQNAIATKAKARGLSGPDINAAQASFAGQVAGERTLGTREANMDIAANEVKNMAPLALSASEKVDRTQFPTLNGIILSAEKGSGDENVVRFGLAANSLIYMYAKFLNPNGIPTDADKAKATDILSTAWSKGQFKSAVDQIKQEISVGQQGLKTTKAEVGQDISGKTPADDKPPGGTVIRYDADGNQIK